VSVGRECRGDALADSAVATRHNYAHGEIVVRPVNAAGSIRRKRSHVESGASSSRLSSAVSVLWAAELRLPKISSATRT
jgi:hypothetical protein